VFVASYERARPKHRLTVVELRYQEFFHETEPKGLVPQRRLRDSVLVEDDFVLGSTNNTYEAADLNHRDVALACSGNLRSKIAETTMTWVALLERTRNATLTSATLEFVFDEHSDILLLSCRSRGLLSVSRPNLQAPPSVATQEEESPPFVERLATARSQPLYVPTELKKKPSKTPEPPRSFWQAKGSWPLQTSTEGFYDAALLKNIVEKNAPTKAKQEEYFDEEEDQVPLTSTEEESSSRPLTAPNLVDASRNHLVELRAINRKVVKSKVAVRVLRLDSEIKAAAHVESKLNQQVLRRHSSPAQDHQSVEIISQRTVDARRAVKRVSRTASLSGIPPSKSLPKLSNSGGTGTPLGGSPGGPTRTTILR
jgi:hypothetical protein